MRKDSSLTLRQGLDRLLRENALLFSDREVSRDAQEFFRCHDVAHVVFGCDTSLFGEGVLKIFTIFGTTLGFWKHLSGYAEASAFSLFRRYSPAHVARNAFWLILNIPGAIVRAKRMSRLWPWRDHGEYLDWQLAEIRREFNINVVPRRPSRAPGDA